MPHLTHSLPAAAFPLYACLQSYNGPSLDSKLEAVTIDKSSVESAMASVLPPVPVATNAAAVPEVTSLPARCLPLGAQVLQTQSLLPLWLG